MIGLIHIVLLTAINVDISESIVTQQRWCQISAGEWLSYNDSISACVSCGSITKLVEKRTSSSSIDCCSSSFQSQCSLTCQRGNELLTCANGRKFCSSSKCDDYNDCGDGSDESNSAQTTCRKFCSANDYGCAARDVQCFDRSKVCNGAKDCFSGVDEINCLFYEGRCRGFLCTKFPQCVLHNEVCNGKKECLDGSDEEYCSKRCQPNQFDCNALDNSTDCSQGRTISFAEVCNGNRECRSGIDEVNCFTWSQWSSWSAPCQCAGLLSQTGQKKRSKMCITFHRPNLDHPGKCESNPATETAECTCTPAFDQTTLIVVVSLTAVIIFVGVVAIVCLVRVARRNRRKKRSERLKQALDIPMYNNTDPNAPAPPPALPPDRSPAISQYSRQSHLSMPTIHAPVSSSPYLRDRYNRPSAVHAQMNHLDRSPAMSRLNRPSAFTTSSSMLDASSDDVSRGSRTPRGPPLPARPSPPDDVKYQRIKDVDIEKIDPYAQTRRFARPSTPLSTSTGSGLPVRTPESFDSVLDAVDGVSTRSGSGKYTPQYQPYRGRTVSRFPFEELGEAPRAPGPGRARSTETVDTEGYLLPTPRKLTIALKRRRSSRSSRSSVYTAMSSPERNKPFRLTLSGPVTKKGYSKVYKKNGRKTQNPLRRQQQLERTKSYAGSSTPPDLDGRISPTHSETYAIMRRNIWGAHPSTASSTASPSADALAPNEGSGGNYPPLSPPRFDPPVLKSRTSAKTKSRSRGNHESEEDEENLSDDFPDAQQLHNSGSYVRGKSTKVSVKSAANIGNNGSGKPSEVGSASLDPYFILFKSDDSKNGESGSAAVSGYDKLKRDLLLVGAKATAQKQEAEQEED